MKFDRLRLSGFKSFVDPVDLQILPGLTGVVGPNGCGKSNLLEALRWVMGETSYKSMRGAGMEDVIFSGTTGRPSRNNAEVSLLLDNHDKSAPPEFNDEENVEVTRRIERDAGSAYRINGRDVRAKDVQLLFADASTGARSPALVKQGQIGELINAKPEARRKILEEAAGISGLHTRRHDAELRLRGAESNLEKVDDALENLHNNLRALKRQVRQATRYKNLSGQIKEVEALALHLRWQQALDAATEAENALAAAEASVASLTGDSASASTEQLAAQDALPPLREKEAECAAIYRRLTIEQDGLEKEAQRATETVNRLTVQIETIQEDARREQDVLTDAENQLKQITEEKEILQEKNAGASGEAVRAAEKAAQEKCDASEKRLAEVENELNATIRKLAAHQARKTEITAALENNRKKHSRIEEERTRLEQERDTLLEEGVSETRRQELKTSISTLSEDYKKAAESVQGAHDRLVVCTEQAETCTEPSRQARAVLERLLGEQSALQAILNASEETDMPGLIETLKVETGYEAALGAAFGDDLNAPSDAEAAAHWLALPPLSALPSLPEGATPLSGFVDGSDVLSRSLSLVGLVDSSMGAALQKHLSAGQRLVSLEGDLWRWDGYCATAEAKTPAAQRLAQMNRLDALTPEIASAEQNANTADEAAETAKAKVREATDADNTCRAELKQIQIKLTEAREELSEMESGAEKQISRLAAIEEACQRMTSDIDELAGMIKAGEADLQILIDGGDALTSEQSSHQELVGEARSVFAQDRAERESLVRERNERENRLKRLQQDAGSWQSRLENSRQQIESLNARQTLTEQEKLEAENIPQKLAERSSALVEQINLAETNRKQAADTLAEAENRLAEADKRHRAAQSALSEVRETRAALEAKTTAAKERLEEIGQHIKDTLHCAPEDALAIANFDPEKKFPESEEIEAKLERYRRERESLGGVNLRAEEEAEEVEAQINEIQTERDDLSQAINKLRYGIGQLNREGRERLLAAFETVNGHFAKLFTQLFGGGTAELKLTESDDPLEAGLEIIAHPPGKKPQVMSLLSGGEQALTAMSLIFAVFLTNPSPICVLDEVDAPLDDANVERFCNMLTNIAESSDTRFLIITHHALTMARVNRLFGVTMQERGVSQLISVDLATAEQFAETGRDLSTDQNKDEIKSVG